MLLLGIALGLLLGLAVGGRLANLAAVRLRLLGLLFFAVILRSVAEGAITRGVAEVEPFRVPLLALAYGSLVVALWSNRRLPGFPIAIGGVVLNGIAILANGGAMPVWGPSLRAAGFDRSDLDGFHVLLDGPADLAFILRAGPLGDVIPLPLPVLANVLSLGDVILGVGLAFFLFATLVRPMDEEEAEEERAAAAAIARGGVVVTPIGRPSAAGPGRIAPGTGLAAALVGVASIERPIVLGGPGLGLTAAGVGPVVAPALPVPLPGIAVPEPAVLPLTLGERLRRHPYVRLALDGRFSAFWVGQLISLFGDRVHQLALAFLVLGVTESPLAVALVFVAATLPNLILGPIAGTFVDRWDRRRVLVWSDLIRAGTVVLVPFAASVDVYLVYPLVFLLTSVSVFFRPARTALLPRIVREEDLLPANSAIWVGETLADVIGYPLAGLFVAFVGTAGLSLAFWLDGATYLVSAILLAAISIPAVARSTGDRATDPSDGTSEAADEAGEAPPAGFRAELLEGLRFLRGETVLLVNTLQAVAGQLANGALVALAPVYAQRVLGSGVDPVAAYALLETGIGLGGLVGGFAVGLVGTRLRKGPLVIVGYTGWGLGMAALALTDALPVAFALTLLIGVANMVYLIPSQTLFQERTPESLIGRVVGSRFSLVFGATTLSMAAGGLLGEQVGVETVIGGLGLFAAAAGLAGLLVPAVRRA